MLSDSCVIATFTGKMWSGRRFDKSATDEVIRDKGAERNTARVNKVLLPNNVALKQIKQKLAAMRHYHYESTLPWQWRGGQLLPSAMFMDYTKTMNQAIAEWEKLVDSFCDPQNFNTAVEAAKIRLGSLFSYADYPSPNSLRTQFEASYSTDPVPSSGDIRVDLPNQVVEDLKAQWVRKEGQIVRVATEHLWTKLHDLAEKFHERTSDPDNSFHKTLTSNITEFTQILDKLNIGEDRFLTSIGQEVAKLGEYDIEDLRKNDAARADASEQSKALLDKIRNQMEAFHA